MWICIGVCRGQVASSAVSFYQLRVSSTAAQRVADTRRPHSQRGAPRAHRRCQTQRTPRHASRGLHRHFRGFNSETRAITISDYQQSALTAYD